MNNASQLATATVALTFAAVLLISGQWFAQYRLQREARAPLTAPTSLVTTLPP